MSLRETQGMRSLRLLRGEKRAGEPRPYGWLFC